MNSPHVTISVDHYNAMKAICDNADFIQGDLVLLAAAKYPEAVSGIVQKPSFQSGVQRMQLDLNKWRQLNDVA